MTRRRVVCFNKIKIDSRSVNKHLDIANNYIYNYKQVV